MFAEKLHKIIIKSKKEEDIYLPFFFRINNSNEKSEFEALLESKPHIKIFDTIGSQLKELIKSQHPKITFTPEELEAEIKKHLNEEELRKAA